MPFFLDRKKKDKGQGGGGRYDDSSESHHHNRRAIGGKEAITIDAFQGQRQESTVGLSTPENALIRLALAKKKKKKKESSTLS